MQGQAYDAEFRSLHHQYKLCADSIGPNFIGLDNFMKQYALEHCQSARALIQKGQSNYQGEEIDRSLPQRVFEITTNFIRPIDLLSLEITSVDEILPALQELSKALKNFPNLPADYQGITTVSKWETQMNGMKASDSLSEEEARQLKFELEGAMQRFNDIVLKAK